MGYIFLFLCMKNEFDEVSWVLETSMISEDQSTLFLP